MSVHRKGRICILSAEDSENLARGIPPNCKTHYHTGKAKAFALTRHPLLGRVLAFLDSSASTADNLAPAGVFIEIAGTVEYCHLRKTTKPNLKAIYGFGERVAAEARKPFVRRSYYPVA